MFNNKDITIKKQIFLRRASKTGVIAILGVGTFGEKC